MRRGFTLLETMVAMVLLGIALIALAVAFASSGKYGILARRQATAVTLARTLAAQLSHSDYTNANLTNTNPANDTTFTDPAGLFAKTALPTGANAPDASLGSFTIGLAPWVAGSKAERYDAYVNIAPQMDPTNATLVMGVLIAVIVRYRVGTAGSSEAVFMRAVALGYHYNPAAVGVGTLPL